MTEHADFAERNSDSDQLEQLQPNDTLVDRGVPDVLDEGYTAPEKWSPAQGFGNTAAEMRQGETLEQRVVQEEPEVVPDDRPWNPDGESREVGSVRAGRRVDANGGIPGLDHESEEYEDALHEVEHMHAGTYERPRPGL